MPSLEKRNLFGGAITADTPQHLVDVSDIRQVPDTQEVFVYPDSSTSVVTEILQKVAPSNFDAVVKFHFESLAHDNSARSSTVKSVSVVANDRGDATPSAIVLQGEQYVPKFNATNPDRVEILMAVFRLEDKDIDVVVTFNIPLSAADGGAVDGEKLTNIRSDFDSFVKSFQIVDFSLFA